jgi:uncharacterized protein YjbI with pentapeptide repeats
MPSTDLDLTDWTYPCCTWSGPTSPRRTWRGPASAGRIWSGPGSTGRTWGGASLGGAHLELAYLREAHLEGASLVEAHLERASLVEAHLEGADLLRAHLEGANLTVAHLEGADLLRAHLEGANLFRARLEGADLRLAFFDAATALNDVTLTGPKEGPARLADVRWGDVNLSVVDWTALHELGDERAARNWKPAPFKPPEGRPSRHELIEKRRAHDREQSAVRLGTYRTAVRASRQLAVALQDQGLNEEAAHFALRAQVVQRQVFRRHRRYGQYLFSWFLALLAGYGYQPVRTVLVYLATIAGFACMYMQATRGWIPFGLPAPSQLGPLPWYEALILSVSSFHGRGFFQPLQSLGDPIAALAAIEAVIGLLVEISFIATFTQRFFGSK